MKAPRKRERAAKPDVTPSPRPSGRTPAPPASYVVRGSTVETPEGFKLRF